MGRAIFRMENGNLVRNITGSDVLVDMAVERADSYESMGCGKASVKDLINYVVEIADEEKEAGRPVKTEIIVNAIIKVGGL